MRGTVSAAPVRLLLLLLAAAVLVLAVGRLSAADGCRDAGRQALLILRGEGGSQAAVVRRLQQDCRGGDELASTAAAFAIGGRTGAASRLAREAIRREPENFLAWDALALALRAEDPAAARRAVARAQRLNPRGRPVPVP